MGRGARGSMDRERDHEERVPLAAEDYELDEGANGSMRKGKGKERVVDDEDEAERGQTVFALGDEDEH